MSKIKVTNKQLKSTYKNIIVVGYCDLQCLLRHIDATYYNCGVYGWNYDGYILNRDTVLVTGYRNMVGTCYPSYRGITSRYNEEARQLYDSYDLQANNYNYDALYMQLDNLLEMFVNEALNVK